MARNTGLKAFLLGSAAVGVPLTTMGLCALNKAKKDKALLKGVIDKAVQEPGKILEALELAKKLDDMSEFRKEAQEFIDD